MSAIEDEVAGELRNALEELQRREPIFHHPELGTSATDYERMTSDDFWEVGASGRARVAAGNDLAALSR